MYSFEYEATDWTCSYAAIQIEYRIKNTIIDLTLHNKKFTRYTAYSCRVLKNIRKYAAMR